MTKKTIRIAATLLPLAALALYVGVSGDFPLDDDWAYALSVKRLLSGGGLVIPDWASPSLVWHTAWGALFSLAAGFSHVTLRVSTLALAALFILFMRFYRGEDAAQPSLAVALSPLFVLLSFTFMTDVPYLAWYMLALALYLAAWRSDKAWLWLAGGAAAALACLVRQTGIFIPAGLLFFLWLRGRLSPRRALLAAALPAAAAVGHAAWFAFVHGYNWAHSAAVGAGTLSRLASPLRFALEFYLRSAAALMYLGLFTLPFALRALGHAARPGRKDILIAGLALLPLLAIKGAMPYYPDIIRETGLGVTSLGFAYEQLYKASGLLGSPWFWAALTLAAFCSLLFWTANRRAAAEAFSDDGVLLACLTAAPQLAAAASFAVFFDRYILAALPAAALLAHETSLRLAPAPRRSASAACWAALGLMFAWSAAGTADYMAWNRAKAALAANAAPLGIEARAFYNGFDRYGELFYEENMAALKKAKPLSAIKPYDWMGGPVFRAYTSFAPFPVTIDGDSSGDFQLALKAEYRTPLARGPQYLYLYRKNGLPFSLPAEW